MFVVLALATSLVCVIRVLSSMHKLRKRRRTAAREAPLVWLLLLEASLAFVADAFAVMAELTAQGSFIANRDPCSTSALLHTSTHHLAIIMHLVCAFLRARIFRYVVTPIPSVEGDDQRSVLKRFAEWV